MEELDVLYIVKFDLNVYMQVVSVNNKVVNEKLMREWTRSKIYLQTRTKYDTINSQSNNNHNNSNNTRMVKTKQQQYY